MICPECHGDGFVRYPYPCETCGGSTVVYCCEGERSTEPEHWLLYCWCGGGNDCPKFQEARKA
jgi:RecJ-like exonuclease